jgi:hypothetical protein
MALAYKDLEKVRIKIIVRRKEGSASCLKQN